MLSETADVIPRPLLITFEMSWQLGEVTEKTERKRKCHSYLQEGRSREPHASQPHFNNWKSDGATYPGNHFLIHEGQEGDWK